MSTFLIHHTHILYKYMQQLLDTNVAEHLKNQKAEKEQASAEIAMTEDDCNVSLMLKQNVEAEYLEKCINFWKWMGSGSWISHKERKRTNNNTSSNI